MTALRLAGIEYPKRSCRDNVRADENPVRTWHEHDSIKWHQSPACAHKLVDALTSSPQTTHTASLPTSDVASLENDDLRRGSFIP